MSGKTRSENGIVKDLRTFVCFKLRIKEMKLLLEGNYIL